MHLIRDIPYSSAFWGAAWVFGGFPDVRLVGDMPVGCFAMISLAVTNYTDALPHLENLTPTVIREEDVINGTGEALKRTIANLRELGYLDGKKLVVISSAESEMIGADHTNFLATLDPEARFFWGHSLEEDEWAGRDRSLVFAWREYGEPYATTAPPTNPRLVNIIGPTLGCFNAPSDLHEIKRLVQGIGGEINLVYPYECALADTPRLAEGAVNLVMYHEFGESLAQELDRPYLFAPFGLAGTTSFLYELGALLGTPRETIDAFVAQEKRTTLQPVWDLWRGTQSDWFSTLDCCVVAGRSYVDGLKGFLNDELGLRVAWSVGRPLAEGEPDTLEVRRRLHERAPSFVFGSINERIYLAEARSSSRFIPSAFPGPIVRRTVGTPFMGYAGTAHLIQEIANNMYDMVFTVLPVETISRDASPHKPPSPPRQPPSGAANSGQQPTSDEQEDIVWSDEATERMRAVLDGMAYLERFSASRELRSAAEQLAKSRGEQAVTLALFEEMLEQRD